MLLLGSIRSGLLSALGLKCGPFSLGERCGWSHDQNLAAGRTGVPWKRLVVLWHGVRDHGAWRSAGAQEKSLRASEEGHRPGACRKECGASCGPFKMEMCMGVPRDPLLPHVVGHVWWEKDKRENLHGLSGPGRWPLEKGEDGFEELVVYDRRGAAGTVRVLTKEEIWLAQGRSKEEWTRWSLECGSEWEAY